MPFMAKKQIVLGDWFKAMAEKNIHTEIPSCTQTLEAGDTDQHILVVPERYPLEFSKIRLLFPLSKISDVKLFAAVLSGRLEATAIEPPAFIVTSSNSTDETIVADSDVEMETATSAPTAAASRSQHIEHKSGDRTEITNAASEDAVNIGGSKDNVCQKDLEKVEVSNSLEYGVKVIEQPVIHRFQARDENIRTINKVPKDENVDISRDGTSDVIFSQDLVVKNFPLSAPGRSTQTTGVNFKRFRKRETMSGNSFKDLVPFAREPYRQEPERLILESDYEHSTTDFMREEKQRKQMEAIADDLFNNAKSKKRAAAGSSIQTLLSGCR
ncbi:hypothetical protein PR202_gb08351 [Eleusine coracana subsp. coracana]|uniref:Uncharacterized protein n=1 Tax=Eleusine coracana subsp. coracana TaxID=191504 RepID=A0AAV5EEF2_ELECO|nr:hypothetical protein PR202_gb08351 [Eleusine coracana subsp. coracana]